MTQTTQIPQTSAPALSSVTTGPLPGSTKLYLPGVIHPDLSVPMRQIAVHPSAGEPPVTVYDPSGPYTDPTIATDITQGLAPLRGAWLTTSGIARLLRPASCSPPTTALPRASGWCRPFPISANPWRGWLLRAFDAYRTDPRSGPTAGGQARHADQCRYRCCRCRNLARHALRA